MRDLRSQALYNALKQYCRGNVLDVGGASFYLTAKERKIPYTHWTSLDFSDETCLKINDSHFKFIVGDGCAMQFDSNHFDTVLNIQVLEHTFEPIKMFEEITRVLKPGGYAIFLIPQTGTMHLAPHHYYNFTRFWLTEAAKRCNLEIIDLRPLGGWWSSIASKSIYFFLTAFRHRGNSTYECKRNFLFYLLFPAMAIYAIISLPICMLLSLGDLTEDANNHLLIVKK